MANTNDLIAGAVTLGMGVAIIDRIKGRPQKKRYSYSKCKRRKR